jgi:[ribosomal protein S5]-alanine N-acetyltransferase
MKWDNLPLINAQRVRLRAVEARDLDNIFTIFSDPKVMRYWSTPPLPDRDAAAELIQEIHDGFEQRSMLKWGIAHLSDDALIGTATLFNLNLENGRAELGYGLGSANWGKGYMVEALTALIDYSFESLDLRRLEADVDPRNAASLRMVERLGFQREGYLRERWHVNGEIQDSVFFGLLRSEWQNLSSTKK